MIKVNLDKAKAIAHDLRREAREREFKPLDDIFIKQIPGKDLTLIEAQRQQIRDKYAAIQAEIDSAAVVETILELAEPLKLRL